MYLVPAKSIPKKTVQATMGFKGLNRLPTAEDGELSAMTNMSGRYSPVLCPRPPREVKYTLTSGTALFAAGNGKLCWVDGTGFVYDGVTKGAVTAGKKSIAEYFGIILIFPDKKYYNYSSDTFGTISNCPDMSHICVHNNRAFGCGGNRFYASKIGDPLTWDYFPVPYEDASSWQANTADPGDFTGIEVSLNQVKSTKPGCLYELYGDKPTNFKLHKVIDVGCIDGDSIVEIDGALYMLSDTGFRVYTGSVPMPISLKLNETYAGCVAGTDGRLYYASLYTGSAYKLYVYDTYNKSWYMEDNLQVDAFANVEDVLYALAGNKIYKFNSGNETIKWSFESGRLTEWYTGKKVNLSIRAMLELDPGASINIYTAIDDGSYALQESISANGFMSYVTQITPERAHSFKVKMSGTGMVKVYGFVRDIVFGGMA